MANVWADAKCLAWMIQNFSSRQWVWLQSQKHITTIMEIMQKDSSVGYKIDIEVQTNALLWWWMSRPLWNLTPGHGIKTWVHNDLTFWSISVRNSVCLSVRLSDFGTTPPSPHPSPALIFGDLAFTNRRCRVPWSKTQLRVGVWQRCWRDRLGPTVCHLHTLPEAPACTTCCRHIRRIVGRQSRLCPLNIYSIPLTLSVFVQRTTSYWLLLWMPGDVLFCLLVSDILNSIHPTSPGVPA